jgi:hypothetical protein
VAEEGGRGRVASKIDVLNEQIGSDNRFAPSVLFDYCGIVSDTLDYQ